MFQRQKQYCLGAWVVKDFTCTEFQLPAMKHKLQNTQIPPLLKKTKQTPLKKKTYMHIQKSLCFIKRLY